MAEEPKAVPAEAPDEARFGAQGTRATARWIASGFGALPSLALITSLVAGPGEHGFEPKTLAIGIALSALGAVVGILAFAWVLAPLPLSNKDLVGFDMQRIRSRFTTFEQLQDSIDTLQGESATKRIEKAQLDGALKARQAELAATDLAAKEAEEGAGDGDAAAKKRARQLRSEADRLRAAASAAASEVESVASDLAVTEGQLDTRLLLRRDAYRLKAADVVRNRFKAALAATVAATGFVAAGIGFLAVAPKQKPAGGVELVTLKLNEEGKNLLDCQVSLLQALRLGGEAEAPRVITLPTPDCPAQLVDFVLVEPSPLGEVEEQEPLTSD